MSAQGSAPGLGTEGERRLRSLEAPEPVLPSALPSPRPRPSGPWRSTFLRAAFGIAEAPGRVPGERRSAHYRRSLAVADVFAALAAAVLAIPVLGDDVLRPWIVLALPVVVLAGKVIGLYDRDEAVLRKTTLEDAPRLFQLAAVYSLLIWLFEDAFVKGRLGHAQVLGLWVLLTSLAILARYFTRQIVSHAISPERCLVVGTYDDYRDMAAKVARDSKIRADLVGWIPLRTGPGRAVRTTDPTSSGELDDLPRIIEELDVDRVILAPGEAGTDAILDVIRRVKALGVKVTLVPRVFEVVGSSVELDEVGGMAVLGVRHFGLSRSSERLKRATDLVGGCIGLVLAAPLFAAIAIAIRLDSRGSVFFRQTRVGKDGKAFGMIKFRTMVKDAEALKAALETRNECDGLFKIAEDPRITRVGRWLRRTSLDELPQLLNVLRGEMSLVGPRPLVEDEDKRLEGWHRRRLHLTPGMTGHWQILGSSRVPLAEMVKIDYLYVANWSLWTDVKILLRTVPYMAARRGL
jgi:exopolysaccharide biosynthesis polyprenyl glycosylphosphotransferase